MSNARKAVPSLSFNGKNVSTKLAEYLESVSCEDVASGSSDSIDITLQNIDMKWMNQWYPTKGDKISGTVTFQDWNKDGENLKLDCGTFILDEVKFSGGPLKVSLGGVAIPANESFKVRERTKTWKNVTIKNIANEIAKRYGLSLSYSGPTITIASIEQSDKTDSAFLYDLCKKYGLSMKVFNNKIVIYDQTQQEKKAASATITRDSFIDDEWEYTDSIEGTYTGARISYKSGEDNEEISVYLGLKAENAAGSRVLNITEVADDYDAAYYMAAAQVNQSNEQATTISGKIWPNPKICAGICVTISGMGKANGKYFVDKSTVEVSDSRTTQSVELHKCQTRLTYTPKPKPKPQPAKKSYKVGDIVNFHGGTHYVSSWPGARGYSARAGKAKITLGPDCAGNGKAHPWHLIHTDSSSNVYGWVDEGTFD
ncbi:MAG TPA: hypothetical protein H9713_11605 [Candidatus Mediterraneibacter surreyensis]|nr:hypothetical protein [Candidatus Mediterraneibacter surreyensis]